MPDRRTGGGGMQRIDIGGVSLEGSIAGDGRPLLFLHGGDYFAQNRAFLDRLARHWRVFAARHLGFGGSAGPDGFRSVHDPACPYLALVQPPRPRPTLLGGSPFGGGS